MNRAFLSAGWISVVLLLANSARAQCELAELQTSDNACGDEFGSSVAFAGDTLLLGAPDSENNGIPLSGSVHVFEHNGTSWVEGVELLASDASVGARFGRVLSADGDRLVASSQAGRGAAYVLDRVGGVWTESAQLTDPDVAVGEEFGFSLALHGDTVIVGNPLDSDREFWQGSATIFEWDGVSWTETIEVPTTFGSSGDFTGWSVDVWGTTAVVGSPYSNANQGSVYVFEKVGSNWVEQTRLTASNGMQVGQLGHSVAIEGDVIAVGALSDSERGPCAGAVYVYERNSDLSWGPHETQKLLGSDVREESYFGFSVALDGDRLVVSSDDEDLGQLAGGAYLFERKANGWEQVAKMLSSDVGQGDESGFALASKGDTIVLGAPKTDDAGVGNCDSGSAYVFGLAPNTASYGFGESCPCGNDDAARGCANSRGWGAVLGACGSTRVSADDLVLGASFLPANQFSLMFMGDAQVSAPFGDGRRAAGAGGLGVFRYLPLIHSGALGTARLGPGIIARSQSFSAEGRIAAGQTWNFQLWYRDPMGSPCGARFNLTNALSATFVP